MLSSAGTSRRPAEVSRSCTRADVVAARLDGNHGGACCPLSGIARPPHPCFVHNAHYPSNSTSLDHLRGVLPPSLVPLRVRRRRRGSIPRPPRAGTAALTWSVCEAVALACLRFDGNPDRPLPGRGPCPTSFDVVRDFLPTPLSPSDIRGVLEDAQTAPSNCNTRPLDGARRLGRAPKRPERGTAPGR